MRPSVLKDHIFVSKTYISMQLDLLPETTCLIHKMIFSCHMGQSSKQVVLYMYSTSRVQINFSWEFYIFIADGWMSQAYSRLSTTHGHITDCKKSRSSFKCDCHMWHGN